ncbi:MAG: hypothetical protein FWE29_04605 [Defluviitaleaceae bacterium]|nr:hypothetical protein [Defluviitaleaceae bacterium]
MMTLERPELSPDFTMEDLYRLREYNSLRHYKMSLEELKDDIEKIAKVGLERIDQMRKEKHLQQNSSQ